jgi:NADH dehydrogenase [ubiquinone] 1 alpha subcomplex assembly factor 7
MNAGAALADRLAARIRAEGPISYAEFVETALYDEDAGFYARHGSAGRRGDFLTSPVRCGDRACPRRVVARAR